MFKNVRIKRMLKRYVFPFFTVVNRHIRKDDNIILLYSANHGIEHNLLPLRDYLIENNYNKKYSIVCAVESKEYFENDGLQYVTTKQAFFYFFKAGHVFYTTGQIPVKPSKNQIVIHMDHGTTAIKTGNLLSKIGNGDDMFFSYYCAPSELYRSVIMEEFKCKSNNVIINSEPVTDVFFKPIEKYDVGNCSKFGLWTPTFRQSDYLGYDDSEEEELLPTLKQEEYEEFNNILKQYNIKLLVKLHDMQNLSKYKNLHFSNLIIMSGQDFNNRGYNLYNMLMQTDFLLGDYSSVSLQYLLLNKPVGYVIPDFEQYKEKRGFVFENVKQYMPGEKIYTKLQLFSFMKDMGVGLDKYEKERIKVNSIVNQYQDGKSCERLIRYSKLKK